MRMQDGRQWLSMLATLLSVSCVRPAARQAMASLNACVHSTSRANSVGGPLVDHAARYALTVRSFGPTFRGHVVRGTLWLWPGAATDMSPGTGQYATSSKDGHQPWFGATDINLDEFRREGPADELSLRARVDP